MSVDNLLIIGNGFDLQSKLKSSYDDFFNAELMQKKKDLYTLFSDGFVKLLVPHHSFNEDTNYTFQIGVFNKTYDNLEKTTSEIAKDPSFSFWNLVFVHNETSRPDWNDIEKRIERMIYSPTGKNSLVDRIEKVLIELSKSNLKRGYSTVFTEKEKETFMFALYIHMVNKTKNNIYLYLLEELKKFEQQFYSYLKYETENNDVYKKNIRYTLKNINDSYSSKNQTNVINFNYTTVKNLSNVSLESNVHGSLTKESIIFGIDLTNLNDDKGSFYFTKTYRKMHAFEDVQIDDFRSESILDDNIKRILFYGHSLNESDYSYFQSIFDYYEIYNSHVSLVFFYSVYDSEKATEIKESYTNAVINLLNIYGETMANRYHGKNFLHKLMLENRVILKMI